MKLTVLVDNNTYIDWYYLGEPAVSYYIEIDDNKILFDTGYSDILISNAKSMDIDLNNLTHIVLSHGHDDHIKGLKYLNENFDLSNVEIISHPNCFYPKKSQDLYIGSPYNLEYIENRFNYIASRNPYKISENCLFLGEIPRINNFEAKEPIGKMKFDKSFINESIYLNQKDLIDSNDLLNEKDLFTNKDLVDDKGWLDDYILDDSAIVYKTDRGIFIITGCSHSGICNIIDYAKKITDEDRVLGVIGGFHLFDIDCKLNNTIDYFKNSKIEKLYPCHCVSLKAKSEMIKFLEVEEVGVGLKIEI